mmetsp:Transcript_5843/g.14005  ORF Transcript_5843/g.14005 Transcript_5843/m.14005 type:complete len:138 (+) Transcript_5843:96-509(+)
MPALQWPIIYPHHFFALDSFSLEDGDTALIIPFTILAAQNNCNSVKNKQTTTLDPSIVLPPIVEAVYANIPDNLIKSAACGSHINTRVTRKLMAKQRAVANEATGCLASRSGFSRNKFMRTKGTEDVSIRPKKKGVW